MRREGLARNSLSFRLFSRSCDSALQTERACGDGQLIGGEFDAAYGRSWPIAAELIRPLLPGDAFTQNLNVNVLSSPRLRYLSTSAQAEPLGSLGSYTVVVLSDLNHADERG